MTWYFLVSSGILQQIAPLVIMAAGGVLADERRALAVLEVEDLVLVTVDVEGHIAPDNW